MQRTGPLAECRTTCLTETPLYRNAPPCVSHDDVRVSHGGVHVSHGDVRVSHGDVRVSHGAPMYRTMVSIWLMGLFGLRKGEL